MEIIGETEQIAQQEVPEAASLTLEHIPECCVREIDYCIRVEANMQSPPVSVMQMLLFCIRIVWSTMYSNADIDGRGSYFESWLWAICVFQVRKKRQIRQRDSNYFVSYWYDVLIWFIKKRYFDLSAGVVEMGGVIGLRFWMNCPSCCVVFSGPKEFTIR
ncbi:hypothetical protein OUZ56_026461 [Daphnia magna]|uniref:Uncharacterized protein n=1 Tax=Daphnia magna TaxID=35525 RepID=A0ABQ9ZLS7_9CRUS|nr:hypothetical protein OUZ56_026461 [Daphnia magna]